MSVQQQVRTRLYIVSDTHGDMAALPSNMPDGIDVAVHCGDLTDGSKLEEFKTTIQLLKNIDAPLKLVIAGNHDFTLDIPMFKKKIAEVKPPLDPELVEKEYGSFGQIQELFDDAKYHGIMFLDEGNHHFSLSNGASLSVYASPFTPSNSDWGFEYHPDEDHEWQIGEDTDVVITHGPPRGIFDLSDSKRLGSPSLFTAVAKSRPRLHCFGHVHRGWGARLASWRPSNQLNNDITHFTAIDNASSTTIETLSGITQGKYDSPDQVSVKTDKLQGHLDRGYICTSHYGNQDGSQTLFVNAAIKGSSEELPHQLPWVVDLELPRNTSAIPSKAMASADTDTKKKAQKRTATDMEDNDGATVLAKRRNKLPKTQTSDNPVE